MNLNHKWMVSEEELDDKQYHIRALKDDDYLIEGCAGSGKTVLALHKAKEIQDSNKGSYLVIIFTKALRSFIEDGITALGLNPKRVCHYNDLKNLSIKDADYIIVDEVQDFSNDELELLDDMASQYFICFGDDDQQIYSRKTNNITLQDIKDIIEIEENNHHILKKNYRLPRKIAEFAHSLIKSDDDFINRCVNLNSEKPLIIKYSSQKNEWDDIMKIITTEEWSDVGILVRNNQSVKEIVTYLQSQDFDVEYKYDENYTTFNTLNFNSSLPKVLTYHSSKGLQFEHVFMPSCNINSREHSYKEALFVAITRTYRNLFISYYDVLSPFIQDIDKSLYDIITK